MDRHTIFLIILAIVIIVPLAGALIWIAYDEHRYRTKGSRQNLMFNELSKGDYIWFVNNQGVTYRKVKHIKYIFRSDNRHIDRIKIYYGDDEYVEVYASEAKSFKHNGCHTVKQAAELEYKRIENARNESISDFKGATSEDIEKAQKKLLEQLNKIK